MTDLWMPFKDKSRNVQYLEQNVQRCFRSDIWYLQKLKGVKFLPGLLEHQVVVQAPENTWLS